jgi:hypothetical protein
VERVCKAFPPAPAVRSSDLAPGADVSPKLPFLGRSRFGRLISEGRLVVRKIREQEMAMIKPFATYTAFAVGSFVLSSAAVGSAFTLYERYPRSSCTIDKPSGQGAPPTATGHCPWVTSNAFDTAHVGEVGVNFYNDNFATNGAPTAQLCTWSGANAAASCSSVTTGTQNQGAVSIDITSTTILNTWINNSANYSSIELQWDDVDTTFVGYKVLGN